MLVCLSIFKMTLPQLTRTRTLLVPHLELLGDADVLLPDLLRLAVPADDLLLQVGMVLGLEVLVRVIPDGILDTLLNSLILLKPLINNKL